MKVLDSLARGSARVSVFCALLALITLSSAARADESSDCAAQCAAMGGNPTSIDCISECLANGGCSHSGCTVDCDVTASYPTCGNYKCDKTQACVNVPCKCTLIFINEKAHHCECAKRP